MTNTYRPDQWFHDSEYNTLVVIDTVSGSTLRTTTYVVGCIPLETDHPAAQMDTWVAKENIREIIHSGNQAPQDFVNRWAAKPAHDWSGYEPKAGDRIAYQNQGQDYTLTVDFVQTLPEASTVLTIRVSGTQRPKTIALDELIELMQRYQAVLLPQSPDMGPAINLDGDIPVIGKLFDDGDDPQAVHIYDRPEAAPRSLILGERWDTEEFAEALRRSKEEYYPNIALDGLSPLSGDVLKEWGVKTSAKPVRSTASHVTFGIWFNGAMAGELTVRVGEEERYLDFIFNVMQGGDTSLTTALPENESDSIRVQDPAQRGRYIKLSPPSPEDE